MWVNGTFPRDGERDIVSNINERILRTTYAASLWLERGTVSIFGVRSTVEDTRTMGNRSSGMTRGEERKRRKHSPDIDIR